MQHTPDKLAELAEKGYYDSSVIAQAVKAFYQREYAKCGKAQQANVATQEKFGISERTVYNYIRPKIGK